MKIIYTKANAKGEYNDVGMTDRGLTSDYKTTSGFLRYGLPANFYGNRIRLQVFYGDSIYQSPDKVIYVTV
jgi:hypothetical protein